MGEKGVVIASALLECKTRKMDPRIAMNTTTVLILFERIFNLYSKLPKEVVKGTAEVGEKS